VRTPSGEYRKVEGAITMSGSVEDWKSEGMQGLFRKGLAKGLRVKAAHVEVLSVVSGSARITFAVFQDESYTDAVSVRVKLTDPTAAAKVAQVVEEKTGANVVSQPYAERETLV
jgi:hypothetical protein